MPLRVADMTEHHARWWDEHVQPAADRIHVRADRGWEWPKIRRRGLALGRALALTGRGHNYRALTLGIERSSTGEFVPFGNLLVVDGYPALDNPSERSVFIWYLADAPWEATQNVLPDNEIPKACASILLDVALTISFDRRYQGRVGLHAAPIVSTLRKHGPLVQLDLFTTAQIQPITGAVAVRRRLMESAVSTELEMVDLTEYGRKLAMATTPVEEVAS